MRTRRAKWVSEKREDAKTFAKEKGSKISTFEEAMKAAYADLYADTKMIRNKRKMQKIEKPEPKKK